MTERVLRAIAWGAGTAALAFVALLAWRTLRRARREAGNRAKEEAERQPEHRARLSARLGCSVDALPALGGWKITPDFACLLLDLVDELRPRRVLELGSGTSTLLLAQALGALGGRLASLEQDAGHVELTRRMLAEAGLGGGVQVEHAPLRSGSEAREGDPPWYAAEALARFHGETGPPWNLVVVDGPSTEGRADARMPALPRLLPLLAPDAVVVLDDAFRPGERAVVAAWRGLGLLQDFVVEDVPLARGAVILRRRPAESPRRNELSGPSLT